MSITQTIASFPDMPSRQSPSNFISRADAGLERFETLPDEMNSWASQANSLAGDVNIKATAVAASVATMQSITAYKGAWDSGTTYVVGDSVSYDDLIWISDENANTGNTPSTSGTHWTLLPVQNTYHAKEYTSGTFSSSLASVVDILLVGGGASGNTHTNSMEGGGGGAIIDIKNVTITGDLTITIGAGGAAVTSSSNASANSGAASTISGGIALTANGAGSHTGGSNSTTILTSPKAVCGGNGYTTSNYAQSVNGYGSCGSGSYAGGGSYGDGGNGVTNADATDGVKGGGGGGVRITDSNSHTSGAGGDGYCIIGYWGLT